jgi:hypothetical protein
MQNRYYMKDEIPFSDFPVYTEKSRNGSKLFVIFLIIILLIGGVVGGLYFLGKSQKSESNTAVIPTSTPAPTEIPSPSATVSASLTPTPSSASANLDRSKLSVSVLNGSGVRGAANTTAATLRNLGYVVGATGNAERFNYTGVTILIKKAKSNYGDLIKKDLEVDEADVIVDETIATDAVVIVGR